MVVVYRVVYRTLDALYQPRTVAAVLLVGDDLYAVAGATEGTTVQQFRTILVVGAADGEHQLGDVALEGAQPLAEGRLQLVEAYQCLACKRPKTDLVI